MNRLIYSFLPDYSPYPLTKDFNLLKNSPIRVFSKNIFEKSPNLFLFGEHLAFYDVDHWVLKEINQDQEVELPWMNFKLKLLFHSNNKVPTYVPYPVMPIQEEGKLVKGATRSILLNIRGQNFWVTNQKPITLSIDGHKHRIAVNKKSVRLPYEVSLTRFKMDLDPGTNRAASYESFIQLFTDKGPSKHHVFMNNPLKYEGLTFYQASYFKTNEGHYGSVLSVNKDPGRPIKYLGSLLLVLGAIWHFYIRKKKIAPNKTNSFSTQLQESTS